jgi:DNA-binding transcriptional MerR regulator
MNKKKIKQKIKEVKMAGEYLEEQWEIGALEYKPPKGIIPAADKFLQNVWDKIPENIKEVYIRPKVAEKVVPTLNSIIIVRTGKATGFPVESIRALLTALKIPTDIIDKAFEYADLTDEQIVIKIAEPYAKPAVTVEDIRRILTEKDFGSRLSSFLTTELKDTALTKAEMSIIVKPIQTEKGLELKAIALKAIFPEIEEVKPEERTIKTFCIKPNLDAPELKFPEFKEISKLAIEAEEVFKNI